MLVGKELEMYQVQGKKVQIYLNDGSELVGMCTEFSSAYDNDLSCHPSTQKQPRQGKS